MGVPEIQDGIIEIKKAFPETLDDEQKLLFVQQTVRSVLLELVLVTWAVGFKPSCAKSTTKKSTSWNGTKIQKLLLETRLKPATVSEVIIQNEENREATVVVPDDQPITGHW